MNRRYIARLNSDGSIDSSFAPNPGADAAIYTIAMQPDGKILIGGAFTAVNNAPSSRIARLNPDGSLDTNFAGGAGAAVNAITVQPDGKILIGGAFTAVNNVARNYIARLDGDGLLDPDFAVDAGTNGNLVTLALQPDGTILIGGAFTAADGIARNRIARLNTNGTLDPLFNPGSGMNDFVASFALQADGKIFTAGAFTTVNGVARTRIARLNGDGSLDISYATRRGPNSPVDAIALQPDGKILVGGRFTMFNDIAHRGITRLQPDGSVDLSFNPGLGANDVVRNISLQPDGKIIISGFFSAVDGVARRGIARLNPDGSLDETFAIGGGTVGNVYTLAVQPDGKIVIGGTFTSVNGIPRGHIARLNSDGSVDTTFAPSTGANHHINSLAVDANGNIVIGGWFTAVNGVGRSYLARLTPNGSLDTSFTAGADNYVFGVAIQPNGKIVVGGQFGALNGMARTRIGRLNADGTLDTSFALGGGIGHSSTSPYIHRIKFQADGKVLIAGQFTSISGMARGHFARLNTNGSLDTSFAPGGADDIVYPMEIQPDGKLLIGGTFSTMNGTRYNHLARLQAAGTTPPASPNPSPSPVPNGPRVFLSRPLVTVGISQSFQVDLRMDTFNREVDTLDAYLDFDPAALEVIDAAGNPVTALTLNSGIFDSATFNRVNNSTGQINLSASKYDAPFPNGVFTIASIRFRAKAAFATTEIRFVQSGARQSDLIRAGTSLQPSFGNTTVRILAALILNGRIALEQRGPINTARWITELFRTEGVTTTGGISLYEPGTSTLVGQFSATTDQMGRFSATLDNVPVGVYDIQVKGSNTLSNKRTNIDLSDPTIEHDFGTLRVGDSTGNDTVNGSDVSYMVPSFLLTSSDPGFLPYADTNNNGAINGGDVSALVPNFLRSGPLTDAQALAQPARQIRAEASTPATIGFSPALSSIKPGAIVPIQVQVALGAAEADTLDLYLNFDPQLLEVVGANGQPVERLTPSSAAFPAVTYNKVSNERGEINLSASRFDAPASGNVTVATFYVRAKRIFSTTAITVATSAARQSDLFIGGESLSPAITGGVVSMGEIHRTFVPSAVR